MHLGTFLFTFVSHFLHDGRIDDFHFLFGTKIAVFLCFSDAIIYAFGFLFVDKIGVFGFSFVDKIGDYVLRFPFNSSDFQHDFVRLGKFFVDDYRILGSFFGYGYFDNSLISQIFENKFADCLLGVSNNKEDFKFRNGQTVFHNNFDNFFFSRLFIPKRIRIKLNKLTETTI